MQNNVVFFRFEMGDYSECHVGSQLNCLIDTDQLSNIRKYMYIFEAGSP